MPELTDLASPSGPWDAVSHPGLERLCAGGRHIRLLISGTPPPGLVLPRLADLERVVTLARPGQAGPIIADPQRLPFVEAVFDRVLATTHLPRPAARGELRELWRVLAPAGLALLVVKARRPWQFQAPGWQREALAPVLEDAMFEVLDWRVATLPDRWHMILMGKRDGLRPAMIGRVATAEALATAGG